MSQYAVTVAYETGFTMVVEADSQEQAEVKAKEIVDECGGLEPMGLEPLDVVHRDWFVTGSEFYK